MLSNPGVVQVASIESQLGQLAATVKSTPSADPTVSKAVADMQSKVRLLSIIALLIGVGTAGWVVST